MASLLILEDKIGQSKYQEFLRCLLYGTWVVKAVKNFL